MHRREEVTDHAGAVQVREVRENLSDAEDVLRGPHAEGQLTLTTDARLAGSQRVDEDLRLTQAQPASARTDA